MDERAFAGLRQIVGRRKTSRLIESSALPLVLFKELLDSYREMTGEETRGAEARS
jgi:hypothetical protein